MQRLIGLVFLCGLVTTSTIVAQDAPAASSGTASKASAGCDNQGGAVEAPRDLLDAWKRYKSRRECVESLKARTKDRAIHRLLTDRVEITFKPQVSNTIASLSLDPAITAGPFKFKAELAKITYKLPFKEAFQSQSRVQQYFLDYWEFGASVSSAPPKETFKLTQFLESLDALQTGGEIYLQFKLPVGQLRKGNKLKEDLTDQRKKLEVDRDALLEKIAEKLAGDPTPTTK
ncbi:MAG: hypothetical protein ACRD2Y_07135 [Terriglobales bacterium]